VVLERKFDLDYTLKRSKLKIIITFKIIGKNKQKVKENGKFYANPIFDKILITNICNICNSILF